MITYSKSDDVDVADCLLVLDGLSESLFVPNGQTWKDRPVWEAVNSTSGNFTPNAFIYWKGMGDIVWNVGTSMPSDPDVAPTRIGFISQTMSQLCPNDGAMVYRDELGKSIQAGFSFRASLTAPYAACIPVAGAVTGKNTTEWGAAASVTECARKTVDNSTITAVEFRNGTCYSYSDPDATVGVPPPEYKDSRACKFKINSIPGYGKSHMGSGVKRIGLLHDIDSCASAVKLHVKDYNGFSFDTRGGICMGFDKLEGSIPYARTSGWLSAFIGEWVPVIPEPIPVKPNHSVPPSDVAIAVLGAAAGLGVLAGVTGLTALYRDRYCEHEEDDNYDERTEYAVAGYDEKECRIRAGSGDYFTDDPEPTHVDILDQTGQDDVVKGESHKHAGEMEQTQELAQVGGELNSEASSDHIKS